MEREISSNDVLRFYERLNSMAESGTLTEAVLHEAMQTYEEDNLRVSLGTMWLAENSEKLGSATDDPEGFLRVYLDTPHCLDHLISEVELLKLIPASNREVFLRGVYVRHGSYRPWVKTALVMCTLYNRHSVLRALCFKF